VARSVAPKRVRYRNNCVFKGAFVREQVDPRVQEEWKAATGKPAPFGDLRRTFRAGHCAAINPYGGSECPYREEECATAFLSCVRAALAPGIKNNAAYFRVVAQSSGARRADEKPLAREMHREERAAQGPGDEGSLGASPQPGHAGYELGVGGGAADLRGPFARPTGIREVLRSFNVRPREGPADDGKEGSV
jgi:hypothetical protein